jgi:branched-chain amino acid transport system substrate-binding protein
LYRGYNNERRKNIMRSKPILVLAAVVAVAVLASWANAAPIAGTVKFGYTGALTGPAAQWGNTGLQGVTLWADDVNARGGIEVAGKRYKVEVIAVDDKAMPSEVLKATRKLVFEDKVSAVSNFLFCDAAAPFCTQQKILQFGIVANTLRPEWPYQICAGNSDPEFQPTTIMYAIQKLFPKVKTMAITSQDTEDGSRWRKWYSIGADLAGVRTTYNKAFAEDTIDFAPIVSAMLATKPDLLCWDGSYMGFNALLTEQAYQQGFQGPIVASSADVEILLSKVPSDWLEGKYITSFPDWDDPALGKKANAFWSTGRSKWGKIANGIGMFIDQCGYWEQGSKLAGSFDPVRVRNAILNADELQSTYGPASAKWYANYSKKLYGISNYILPKKWPVNVIRGGKGVVDGWIDYEAWFNKYGDRLMRRLSEEGLLRSAQ